MENRYSLFKLFCNRYQFPCILIFMHGPRIIQLLCCKQFFINYFINHAQTLTVFLALNASEISRANLWFLLTYKCDFYLLNIFGSGATSNFDLYVFIKFYLILCMKITNNYSQYGYQIKEHTTRSHHLTVKSGLYLVPFKSYGQICVMLSNRF